MAFAGISELRITRQVIKKLWDLIEISDEQLKPEEYEVFLDKARVYAFIPKTKKLKIIFKEFLRDLFYTKDDTGIPDIFKLEYKVTDDKEEIKSSYDAEILNEVIQIFKNLSETIIFKMKTKYPLWIENDYLIFVLAPRIEDKW